MPRLGLQGRLAIRLKSPQKIRSSIRLESIWVRLGPAARSIGKDGNW
jgi:hypothetical protein